MSLDAIGIAGSGLTLHRKWLDAIADNIANVNTVTPTSGNAFQARYIVAQAGAGVNGVEVAGTAQGSVTGILVSDPTNPSPTRTATSATPTSTSASRWAT